VRDALAEEKERADEEPATAVAEDGSTDEGAGDGPAPLAEEATAEAPEPEAEPEPEPQEDPLTAAKREASEYLDLAKRTQADFENYRKRAAKDIAGASGRARAGLIRELLPVVDNLERALTAAPAEGDGFVEGVRLVLVDLQGVLQRAGVEPIEPKGEPFDPTVHEALTTRQEEGVDAGVVLDVVEKGYKGADQVIRPARVIVAA
jgi:molecular chaperone GrpE